MINVLECKLKVEPDMKQGKGRCTEEEKSRKGRNGEFKVMDFFFVSQ